MAYPKKTPSVTNSAYKIEAAARRTKIASMASPIANEITPVQGRIRARLDGKAISSAREMCVFGPPSIDIPEFSLVRKTKRD